MQEPVYLVWSNEHSAWWGPRRSGYYLSLDYAGRYSRDEALKISAEARGGWKPGDVPPEMPVRFEDAIAVERECLQGIVSGDEAGDG